MKAAIIDIGSNSIRLGMLLDGKTLYKEPVVTKLAEGMRENRLLSDNSVLRTINAIKGFMIKAKKEDALVFAFATEAVRSSLNCMDFIKKVKESCELDVDIIDSYTEAKFSLAGALDNLKSGAIIDIGGASTEISALDDNQITYNTSIKLGAVTLTDAYGQNKNALEKQAKEKLKEFSPIPKNIDYFAVGGTACSFASIFKRLKVFDLAKIHQTKLSYKSVCEITDLVFSMPVNKRKNITGLAPSRAEVIGGGSVILKSVMEIFGFESLIVSAMDNIEGYYKLHVQNV